MLICKAPVDALRVVVIAERARLVGEELMGPSPSPIRRLLARRAVLCWMRVQEYELSVSGADTIVRAEHQHRRLNSAHRRLLSSPKALALVAKVEQPGTKVRLNLDIDAAGQVDAPAPPHRLNGWPDPSLEENSL